MEPRTVTVPAPGVGKQPEPTPAAPGGVPAPAPAAQPGMAPATPIDATPDQSVDQLKGKLDRDISRLRSTYDRQMAQLRQQWENERSEWENRYHAANTAGMEEAERVAYENQVLKEQVGRYQQQAQMAAEAARAQQEMYAFVDKLRSWGVPTEGLDWSNPETLYATGQEALDGYIRGLRTKPATTPVSPTPVTPTPAPTAPPVMTATNTPPPTMTIDQAILALAKSYSERWGKTVTEQDLYDMHARGQINLNTELGLDKIPSA